MSRRSTVIQLIEEFLLINVPILLYVMIEADHRGQAIMHGIIQSPEWCIGTVVMSFQALRLYIYGTAHGPRKSPGLLVALFLFATLITVAAFYLLSMHEHSAAALNMKWLIFVVASIFFVFFGGGGLWGESHYGKGEA